MNAVGLKATITGGLAAICGIAWYNRNKNVSSNFGDRKSHLMIHMDLNKTMIMSDAVQGLSLKKSINTILADRGCFGVIRNSNSIDIDQKYKSYAIDDKVWIPKLITTNENKILEQNKTLEAKDQLFTYGEFIRNSMSYQNHAVDIKIKKERLKLRGQFTEKGNPGQDYAYIVDKLYNKLNKHLVMPAFWKLIDYLYDEYNKDNNKEFSILFRTFGTDLPEVVDIYNQYCKSKGYDKLIIDWNDKKTHGVMIHEKGELYLIIGCVQVEKKYERLTPGITREIIENADRLSFYRNMKDIEIYKGYEEVYKHINKRSMAIRDDWIWWALHNEESEFGKVYLMNKNDNNIQQIFFDDCGSYVFDSRDIQNIDKHIPFNDMDGIHAINANSYEIMTNDDYFIDNIKSAQSKFVNKSYAS